MPPLPAWASRGAEALLQERNPEQNFPLAGKCELRLQWKAFVPLRDSKLCVLKTRRRIDPELCLCITPCYLAGFSWDSGSHTSCCP